MDIFGIGAPELIFIIVIALIVLGPKDMEKTGKTVGKWMRDMVTSDGWKIFQQTTRELQNLPTRLMREANYDFNKIGDESNAALDPTGNRISAYVQADGEKPVAHPKLKKSAPKKKTPAKKKTVE